VSELPSIPGYEIIELVGRNGVGHLIYRARQSATGMLVCLNVAHSCGDFGQMVAEGLRHQAEVLGELHHPNIVRVAEVGEAPTYGFFSALQYVDGTSLAEMVRHAELPAHSEVVRIATQVAAALDYAHGRNIVHGHVHPKHILLDHTGHVFLSGFGEVGPGFPEGAVFGNPHALAPEQLDGFQNTGPQSDIYGLATVVFLLLTGFFPLQGIEGTLELLNRKLSVPAPSIRERQPELARSVDRTLQRAMALRPEDRYQSASQFVEALRRGLHGAGKKWWQFWY
jgi:eukaryotic-like serine/threonine-protein kinase